MTETRVLIVDDAPEIRRIIELLINMRDGWRVVAEARNGEEGVELAGVEQPDVVLLDISMPVMDGLEALPLIRKAAPQALVIMCSGFPSSAVCDSAIEAGAHGYIEKDSLVHTLMPQLVSIVTTLRHGAASATAAANGRVGSSVDAN
jgi:YesN/AraC family two-component response regulator